VSDAPRAPELKLIGCDACGLVLQAAQAAHRSHCSRCEAPLHRRKPNSLARSWALLIAATILYLPANLLPIMRTIKLLDVEDSTILSGVVLLWQNGSFDLAIIVFTASIVVPLVKIVCLALLLITTQRGTTWCQRERARLYRVLEIVGHWSMLDVFVVALLMTLVHFGKFAQVEAGPGVVAFGAVVVLTMLASMSFDPRLIWDTQNKRHEPPADD
jgi:paraquat-inducible protein A